MSMNIELASSSKLFLREHESDEAERRRVLDVDDVDDEELVRRASEIDAVEEDEDDNKLGADEDELG